MSTSFEAPTQYERDLRSANKEWKRGKDSKAKWSYGSRPLPGCRVDWFSGEFNDRSESQREKFRPETRGPNPSEWQPKDSHNVTKFNRPNSSMTPARFRAKFSAHEEITDPNRSISDLPPVRSLSRAMSASDNFLYSFDNTDSPGRALTLDAFVKPVTTRDTERLVEKEYEILDANGQALKGREARRNLRRRASDLARCVPEGNEDEGFELV